jgi:hypothetical protein
MHFFVVVLIFIRFEFQNTNFCQSHKQKGPENNVNQTIEGLGLHSTFISDHVNLKYDMLAKFDNLNLANADTALIGNYSSLLHFSCSPLFFVDYIIELVQVQREEIQESKTILINF